MTEATAEQQAAAARADMRRRLIEQQQATSGPNASLEDCALVVDTALAACDAVGAEFTSTIEDHMRQDDEVMLLSIPIAVLASQLVIGAMQNVLQNALDQARGLGIQSVQIPQDQRPKAN